MRKLYLFSARYLQIAGLAIAASWIFILFSGATEEGSLELGFHLVSEYILALLCFLAGLLLGRGHRKGTGLAMAAHAMLIYSVLNAAGYYAEQGELLPVGLFLLMCLLSVVQLFLLSDRQCP